ncbi:MAG: hypothetical protein ACTHLN_00270 [Tepidisphaeraceae bacterium]
MNRGVFTAFALAGLLAFGCEKKEASSPQVQDAADKTGKEAADALGQVKSDVNKGVEQAKDNAAANTDNMKAGADAIQNNVDDLISKAKDAVKDKKWSDAEDYLAQIKDLKSKLPAETQPKIDASIAEVQKLIDAGKTLVPGK